MLQPKITKYRKSQKGRIKGLSTRGCILDKGDFGLKVLESARISARQIEAIKLTITRTIKRQGKMWLRIFPSKPITKKPAEVRMGKGKGAPEYWAAEVKPGRIIFELGGIAEKSALEAFRLAAAKLQVKTKVVVSKFVS